MRCVLGLCALAACGGGPATAIDARGVDAREVPPYEALNIERVGHVDLDTDANLGLAVAGSHAYVGYKYDGEIDIVDISDPAAPVRVGGLALGWDATEVRAIPDLARLYVLVAPAELVIFDLTDPVAPARISSLNVPNMIGHELFLWRDPAAPSRVLAVVSDVSTHGGFAVLDVSNPSAITIHHRQTSSTVHSVSLSNDGARMYVSYISGSVAVMDSAPLVAEGVAQPATRIGSLASACTAQSATCIAHSAVKVPGRALAVVTYENEKCPKGWMDIVDLTDETMPRLTGTWRHPKADLCGNAEPDLGLFGYGAHNPTVTSNLALVSWYRAGFLMFDISDPAAPTEVARFVPNVPGGSRFAWGRVASVSYPIIKDGLIYVVDGRNGLDILRYVGPNRGEVDGVSFLEGNSNL